MPEYRQAIKEELSQVIEIVSNVAEEHTSAFIASIASAGKIFIVGAGRTGCVAKCFAMRLMQMGLDVSVVGETITTRLNKGDLLVACSVSGKTQTTCIISSSASRLGAKVIAITSDDSSPLAEVASAVVLLPWPAENPPKLATAMELALMLYLDGVVAAVMQKRNMDEEALLKRHTNLE